MKKRFMALFLVTVMVLSMLGTTAFALEGEDLFNEDYETAENYELTSGTLARFPAGGTPLEKVDSPVLYSANSSTEVYEGYLASQSEMCLLPISMYENRIVHATLICPANARLDYDLYICTFDGTYYTPIVGSTLETYIDPNTGKTLDESVSYVHNQGTEETLYIIVNSKNGSSSVDPFYVVVSYDEPGSYDNNEPNDNAAYATQVALTTTLPIHASVTGSLNVINDQDWYVITPQSDVVFKLSAGNYNAEVYRLVADNTLGLADYSKSYDYYALYAGNTYFVKVYADLETDSFSFGNYTLDMTDQSVYTTMETAYDLGYWANSFNRGALPWGQSTAYYKFTINTGDRMYAKMAIPEDGSVVGMVARNSRGQNITDVVTSAGGGVITPSIGSPFLPLPIDGSQVSDGIVYLQVAYGNNLSLKYVPTLSTRVRSGYGDFSFTGTCSNPGYSSSNILSLNLTNNSKIPAGCTITSVTTTGSVSPSVGGITHMVRPASHNWLTPRGVTAVGEGFYTNIPTDIPAKQIWYFRYDQTAFASTKMTNIKLHLNWEQDLQFNNYEIFS